MRVSAIVAMGTNRGIGIEGRLPWKIPSDLRRFKEITTGHPVIMGRGTWDSLPKRPLPNRMNIVLSKSCVEFTGAAAASSPSHALELAHPAEEAFVIGGEQVYKAFWDRIDRLYLTLVSQAPQCDTFFPELDLHRYGRWKEIQAEVHRNQGEPLYTYYVFDKVRE